MNTPLEQDFYDKHAGDTGPEPTERSVAGITVNIAVLTVVAALPIAGWLMFVIFGGGQ